MCTDNISNMGGGFAEQLARSCSANGGLPKYLNQNITPVPRDAFLAKAAELGATVLTLGLGAITLAAGINAYEYVAPLNPGGVVVVWFELPTATISVQDIRSVQLDGSINLNIGAAPTIGGVAQAAAIGAASYTVGAAKDGVLGMLIPGWSNRLSMSIQGAVGNANVVAAYIDSEGLANMRNAISTRDAAIKAIGRSARM